MSSNFTLPPCGFVFWPVATGDSTTLVLKKDTTVQIDLHHCGKSEDEDDPAWPIVDELVRVLPKKDNRPYLSLFILTHPDEDHVKGFEDLLKQVEIGEIWHTPRIFRDYEEKATLCDDAKAFRKEVHRRREAVIARPNDVKSGNRVRVIGHDDVLNDEPYKNFPKEYASIPGTSLTCVDGEDVAANFSAFIHAPFKDDAAKSRNNTSLSLHITLKNGSAEGRLLTFGDREYPTCKQIFEITIEREREQYLVWDILHAPHHCSRKVMYWPNEGEEHDSLQQDIMDYFGDYATEGAHIIISAKSEFTDGEGDYPPHGKARKRYEEIVDAGHLICTHEHPNTESPEPVKFELTSAKLILAPTGAKQTTQASVVKAVEQARGGVQPPQQQVGFGRA
jgi:hypothetical protein